jgi:sodium pump decarboxylase gamma subunit
MFTETMLLSTMIAKALGLTILGMGVVFMVLFLISIALDALREIIVGFEKKKSLSLSPGNDRNITIERRKHSPGEKEELIAVITAAVAAFSKTEGFIVRSARPIYQNNPVWGSAGRLQQMEQSLSLQNKKGK